MNDLPRPELTVAAVVERHGRFLMIEELVQGRPVLNQPAGHVEPGETLMAAVVRETREEAAWEFAPEFITGVYLYGDGNRTPRVLRVAFTGQLVQHLPNQDLDAGILRALWLSRDEVQARSARLRSPMVLRSIDDCLAGHRLPADLGGHELLAERAARL